MQLTEGTWRDAQRMPDDGNRYEAIGGILYVTAAPKWRHQVVSKRLLMRLSELLEDPGHGEVVATPGVEFPATGEGVQPDILFGLQRAVPPRRGSGHEIGSIDLSAIVAPDSATPPASPREGPI
ncbi:Uma2 family endonuclease [Candidatus Palauibacter sp.]|uniref:Uma2 family endonuclease n=1 Tax=Candidatus Palauibacter sp. TaxID=3101350 RepID=UPI003B525431